MAEFLTTEIADRFKPAFRRGFVAAIEAAKQSVSLANMADGLRRFQDPRIDWADFQDVFAQHVIPLIQEIVDASGKAHVPPNVAKDVPREKEGSFEWRKDHIAIKYGENAQQAQARLEKQQPQAIPVPQPAPVFTFSFDVTNPESITWIREHAGELVTNVTDETRMAIRGLVQRSFQEGIPPHKLARMIREHIGLTRPQEIAAANYRAGLEEAIAEESITVEQAARLESRYRRSQIAWRAENIARTETITASNEGQRQLWSQMEGQGFLDKDDGFKSWLVTRDEKLCIACAPIPTMNGPIPRNKPFNTPVGPLMGPTAHPQCRCSTRLHFKNQQGKFPDPPPMPSGWTQTEGRWKPPTPRPTRRLKPRIPRK